MSKHANPTIIGTFVITACALALAAIMVLGNVTLQEKAYQCILYFPGSLHGLDPGAPVTMRGVQIGKVKDISVVYDPEANSFVIPVHIEITEKSTEDMPSAHFATTRETAVQLIEKGLRATLKMRSIVTGKLYIDLAFYPDTPVNLRGKNSDGGLLEIPTLPSGLEQFTQAITDLPINELIEKISTVLEGMDHLLNSSQSREGLTHLASAVTRLDDILSEAQPALPEAYKQLQQGLEAFARLANDATTLLSSAERSLEPTAQRLDTTLAGIDEAIAAIITTLEDMQALVGEDSDLAYDAGRLVREIEAAARSTRLLVEYLMQYPDSFIFGKPTTVP